MAGLGDERPIPVGDERGRRGRLQVGVGRHGRGPRGQAGQRQHGQQPQNSAAHGPHRATVTCAPLLLPDTPRWYSSSAVAGGCV